MKQKNKMLSHKDVKTLFETRLTPYPCLRFRRLIGAYVGDGNHLSRSMCMVVVRRRVRVYNHHTVNDMYVSKHSNAYLVRQKQCQQKQRSQYVPSLTQFLG